MVDNALILCGNTSVLFLDTDVNECDNKPCSQECANVYGSYQCYCRQGYQLAEDGHACKGKRIFMWFDTFG